MSLALAQTRRISAEDVRPAERSVFVSTAGEQCPIVREPE